MNTAVLYIGKTNVKFAVFDSADVLQLVRHIPNDVLRDPPYSHVDVERIWAFLGASLREASNLMQIDVIVPTTHGATGAVIDDHGLVLPIMDYEFDWLQDIELRYNALRDDFKKTFSPAMPAGLNWGRQLAWQKLHHGAAFDRATSILAYPQYWVWRLTGKRANDIPSLGCHTDLWLPLEDRPSQLADAFGISALLAPIIPAWNVVGSIQSQVAVEFGIKSDIKVLCGIHDSNASLLPYLSRGEAPLTVLSTGTWVVAMAVGHPLSSLRQNMDMNANIDASSRPTACARFKGGREFSIIADDCMEKAAIQHIDALIHGDVFALPSFSQNSGPYALHKGQIKGVSTNQSRSSLATLYCALMCHTIIDNLNVSHGDIIIEGSFSRNPLIASLLAQLRPSQKVFIAEDQAGTMRGAAMLAHWPNANNLPKLTLIEPSQVYQLENYCEQWLLLISKNEPTSPNKD